MSKPSDGSNKRVVGPGPSPSLPIPDAANKAVRLRPSLVTVLPNQRPMPTEVARLRPAQPSTYQPEQRSSIHDLPPLPTMRRRRRWPTVLSFLLFAALPAGLAGYYYMHVAADIYVSEFRFSVTENTPILPGSTPAQIAASKTGAAGTGLGALLGGMGGGSASAQNYLVVDYVMSRQVVEELWDKFKLKDVYSKPSQDLWHRFDPSQPFEKFLPYWQSMVSGAYDPVTGLASVKVKAFTPEDAHKIAKDLQTRAENLVNDIAKRAQGDSIKFAEVEVRRAEERMIKARAALQVFRAKENVIDPTTNVVPQNVELAKALRQTLIQQQAELSSLTSRGLIASAPPIQLLNSKIAATREQLAKVEGEVTQKRESTNRTGQGRVIDVVADYERLDLERQYAQTMMVNAQQAYDQARANAAAQHLYLTPYVRPALPQSPQEPRRIQGAIISAAACLAMWLILLMMTRAVRDHVA
jgi:capsular polysaccharide transport system permease protein